MERVKDIATVAHHWANGIGKQAKASNLFFEEDNIYSYGYHFLIAKHVYNERGGHAVLITKRTYSRSTAAHFRLVRQASRHFQHIVVPDPEWPAEELFDKWYEQIKGIAGYLDNSRHPARDILEIELLYNEAKIYADFFGYTLPAYLVEAGAVKNIDEYRAVIKKEQERRKARSKKEQADKLRLQKVDLKRWRMFQIDHINTTDGFDYLRFNMKTRRIETSQRVEIPEAIGKNFYTLILEIIAKGGCTDCDLQFMGDYTVSAINKLFIKVGCHKISMKEIRSFVKQQRW